MADALRPSGHVIVEAAHRDASGVEWEFESNELLRIFDGTRVWASRRGGP